MLEWNLGFVQKLGQAPACVGVDNDWVCPELARLWIDALVSLVRFFVCSLFVVYVWPDGPGGMPCGLLEGRVTGAQMCVMEKRVCMFRHRSLSRYPID